MHYANGRPAKNGDKVLSVNYKTVTIGVLYDAAPGNNFCNGMIAPIPGGQHTGACLADCVHLDDILSLINLNLNISTREQLAKIPNSL